MKTQNKDTDGLVLDVIVWTLLHWMRAKRMGTHAPALGAAAQAFFRASGTAGGDVGIARACNAIRFFEKHASSDARASALFEAWNVAIDWETGLRLVAANAAGLPLHDFVGRLGSAAFLRSNLRAHVIATATFAAEVIAEAEWGIGPKADENRMLGDLRAHGFGEGGVCQWQQSAIVALGRVRPDVTIARHGKGRKATDELRRRQGRQVQLALRVFSAVALRDLSPDWYTDRTAQPEDEEPFEPPPYARIGNVLGAEGGAR